MTSSDDRFPPEPRKRGRPPTGQARSRAQIQHDYRQRNKRNVTENGVRALDENMALREQLLRVLDELDAEKKAGDKARARVRELERQLAVAQQAQEPKTRKAPAEARYALQHQIDLDGEWHLSGTEYSYTSKVRARAELKRRAQGSAALGSRALWRVLDRHTGQILTL
ncbi:hypothetical protein K5D42_25060 [Pseudomonas cichorii]|nr:hypothetical protein [Pseudomonas cichorii]MBX8493143.1 hypothetical protein [Pseudomonas cichorii]